MRKWSLVISMFVLGGTPLTVSAEQKIYIDQGLFSVDTFHNGKPATIMRDQNPRATVTPAFAFTSRKCPPFCIQPMQAADKVETISEMELLDLIQKKTALLVDVRRRPWIKTGTIPGAANLPWVIFRKKKTGIDPRLNEAMNFFGVSPAGQGWDFSDARPLILFDNGIWDGKANRTIKALVAMGYSPEKIYWYRQGMQGWHILGLKHVNTSNSQANYLKYNF